MSKTMDNLRYVMQLRYWLGFYIWMGDWRRANMQCDRIDEFKKEHPVCNFIGKLIY